MVSEKELVIDFGKEKQDLEKYSNYYYLLNFWMKNIEEGKLIETFFDFKEYKKIAIYGMGDLGKHLIKQLPDRLKPVYTVDKGIVKYGDLKFELGDHQEITCIADVIVVTPITDYEEIKKDLSEKVGINIVSLEEVVLSI